MGNSTGVESIPAVFSVTFANEVKENVNPVKTIFPAKILLLLHILVKLAGLHITVVSSEAVGDKNIKTPHAGVAHIPTDFITN